MVQRTNTSRKASYDQSVEKRSHTKITMQSRQNLRDSLIQKYRGAQDTRVIII
jgi:hypothetical protein